MEQSISEQILELIMYVGNDTMTTKYDVEEMLLAIAKIQQTETLLIGILCVGIAIGIAILINQRKLKKELKKLNERLVDKP